MIVFATTDPAKGSRGITAFLVPMDTPGPHGRHRPTTSWGSAARRRRRCSWPTAPSATTRASARRARASRSRCARSTAAASASRRRRSGSRARRSRTRPATRCERKTFGQPIAEHQAIQFKLADMRTEIDAARLLLWRAAVTKDRGGRYGSEAVDGQAVRLRGGQPRRQGGDADLRRLRLPGATSPPSGTSGTPRSPRSTKEPARSSAWSSLRPCSRSEPGG